MTATKTRRRAAARKPRAQAGRHAGDDRDQATAGGCRQALLQRVRVIQDRLMKIAGDEVRAYVMLGREIQEILADPETYGVTTFRHLAPLFGCGRDMLRPCYVLARYFSDAELERLLRLRSPIDQAGLCRGHVMALSRVRDHAMLFELAEKTVAHGWSARQLIAQIHRVQGRSSKGCGGRFRKHEDLAAILRHQTEVVRSVLAQDAIVWTHKHRGMHAQFEKLLADAHGPDAETMVLMDELVPLLRNLGARVVGIIDDYARFRDRLDRARR